MAPTSACESSKLSSRLHPECVSFLFFHALLPPHSLTLPFPAVQYGKSLDWKAENYTTHDVASVFRRYLTHMPVRRRPDIFFNERAPPDVRACHLGARDTI